MSTAIVLPQIGADDEPIRVSCWLIDEGDHVESGDRVVEVLISGMTFDVAAPAAGVLSRIDKPLDATISVGETLGWIVEAPS